MHEALEQVKKDWSKLSAGGGPAAVVACGDFNAELSDTNGVATLLFHGEVWPPCCSTER